VRRATEEESAVYDGHLGFRLQGENLYSKFDVAGSSEALVTNFLANTSHWPFYSELLSELLQRGIAVVACSVIPNAKPLLCKKKLKLSLCLTN
jgi:hypothetical protein